MFLTPACAATSCRSACNTVVPKLVSQDYALFASLLNGVFPGCQVHVYLIAYARNVLGVQSMPKGKRQRKKLRDEYNIDHTTQPGPHAVTWAVRFGGGELLVFALCELCATQQLYDKQDDSTCAAACSHF